MSKLHVLIVALSCLACAATVGAKGRRIEQHREGGSFKMLVKLAEDLYARTGNLEAGILQLRTAFQLCPSCRFDDFNGATFREVFSIDYLNDRLFLTEEIFPAILRRRSSGSKMELLWVGVHPYTLRYEYMLSNITVTTIDPMPEYTLYGSSYRHYTDIAQHAGHYVQPQTFDFVIANGIIGWGVDTPEQVKEYLKVMHAVMKAGAFMIVGYNQHIGSCCSFHPYFRPATFDSAIPQKHLLPGDWQHTFEVFQRNDDLH